MPQLATRSAASTKLEPAHGDGEISIHKFASTSLQILQFLLLETFMRSDQVLYHYLQGLSWAPTKPVIVISRDFHGLRPSLLSLSLETFMGSDQACYHYLQRLSWAPAKPDIFISRDFYGLRPSLLSLSLGTFMGSDQACYHYLQGLFWALTKPIIIISRDFYGLRPSLLSLSLGTFIGSDQTCHCYLQRLSWAPTKPVIVISRDCHGLRPSLLLLSLESFMGSDQACYRYLQGLLWAPPVGAQCADAAAAAETHGASGGQQPRRRGDHCTADAGAGCSSNCQVRHGTANISSLTSGKFLKYSIYGCSPQNPPLKRGIYDWMSK